MKISKKLRLGVIFGGRSPEHDVSVRSAESIMNAADKEKYDVAPIFINRKGEWDIEDLTSLKDKIDIAFPVLHGVFGEDGTIQGLFEIVGVPYIGAGVKASAIAMDKAIAKDLFKFNELPIVKHIVVLKRDIKDDPASVMSRCEDEIYYPCFVKPSNTGSSIGISKVVNKKGLAAALELASGYDSKILIERALDAREIEISVLGNDDPHVSIAGEVSAGDEFYSYDAKYFSKKSKTIIPADISDEQSMRIGEFARTAYKSIDCSGMARVDFFIEKKTGNIYINEINTIPGFTNISMYPKLWESSGLPLPTLIERLTELGMERFNARMLYAA